MSREYYFKLYLELIASNKINPADDIFKHSPAANEFNALIELSGLSVEGLLDQLIK